MTRSLRAALAAAATCLLLAVRHVGGDDWRLYVYGAEKKPLIDVPFELAERPDSGPVEIDVENTSLSGGTLAITLFGKYKAGFKVGFQR